jgi:hypothetical protein
MWKCSSKTGITSERTASAAAKVPRNPNSSKLAKMVAASAPIQRFNNK